MNLRLIGIFGLVAIALLACNRGSNAAKSERDPTPTSREWMINRPAPASATSSDRSLAIPVQPTRVRQGPLPLVYMVESHVTVTVTDATSGAQLAAAPAEPATLVRVEPKRGVFFNTRQIVPGPLDPQHNYAIFVQMDGASSIRSETIAPADSGRP